jgi:hypothetical protein
VFEVQVTTPFPVAADALALLATLLTLGTLRVGTAFALGRLGVLRARRSRRAMGIHFRGRSKAGGILPVAEGFCAIVVSRWALTSVGAVFGLPALLLVITSLLLLDVSLASFTWVARRRAFASHVAAKARQAAPDPHDEQERRFDRLLAVVTARGLLGHAIGILLAWLAFRLR